MFLKNLAKIYLKLISVMFVYMVDNFVLFQFKKTMFIAPLCQRLTIVVQQGLIQTFLVAVAEWYITIAKAFQDLAVLPLVATYIRTKERYMLAIDGKIKLRTLNINNF